MSEREVGRVQCLDCEGGGWVTQLHAPTGERHVLPCPAELVVERGERVAKAIDDLPGVESFTARRLWKSLLTRIDLCHSTSCPCPACDGKGWTLRLVQTGPAQRAEQPA